MKKIFLGAKSERGSSNIIIALSMTAVLIMAAFAGDLGVAYLRTAEVQTAADAAVLAAGLGLPVGVGDISGQNDMKQVVYEYLGKNGIEDASGVAIYFDEPEDGLYMRVGVDVPARTETNFAKIIGVDEIVFTRGAEARAIPCASLSDIVPLSIQADELQRLIDAGSTSHVVLKYGHKTDDVVQGNFGAVDLDGLNGGGANDYYYWLFNGYSGKLSVGDTIPIESGNMAGPTLAGIKLRYHACTHYQSQGGCTPEHYVASCPRVMKVPVVEYSSDQHRSVIIESFAAFVLEDYMTYSSKGYVIGTYVDMVNIGSADGDLTGAQKSYGIYSLTLSK